MAKTTNKAANGAASSTDDQIQTLINRVQEMRKKIGETSRSSYLTNCTFSYSEGRTNDNINLNVAQKDVLLKIGAFLTAQHQGYQGMVEHLEMTNAPPFKWQGFAYSDWMEDIKTRHHKMELASERERLAGLEARLEKIITPELRAKMELEAITAELE